MFVYLVIRESEERVRWDRNAWDTVTVTTVEGVFADADIAKLKVKKLETRNDTDDYFYVTKTRVRRSVR